MQWFIVDLAFLTVCWPHRRLGNCQYSLQHTRTYSQVLYSTAIVNSAIRTTVEMVRSSYVYQVRHTAPMFLGVRVKFMVHRACHHIVPSCSHTRTVCLTNFIKAPMRGDVHGLPKACNPASHLSNRCLSVLHV